MLLFTPCDTLYDITKNLIDIRKAFHSKVDTGQLSEMLTTSKVYHFELITKSSQAYKFSHDDFKTVI